MIGLCLFAASAFEVAALVDHLDFSRRFDTETDQGNLKVLDHVLKSNPTAIWWRDKGGGVPRYASECEGWPVDERPFDRHSVPGAFRYGHLRYSRPGTEGANSLALISGECAKRGIPFGIHTTWEENHYSIGLASHWTLNHPQYWCSSREGRLWMGSCSIAYPEVVEHKLKMVDERLAFKPEAIFLDLERDGNWDISMNYVKPVTDEWRKRYRCEPPADAKDPRWVELNCEYCERYLRAFSAKCHAKGVRFILGFHNRDHGVGDDIKTADGIDWRKLAADGVFDAIAVMGVFFDRKDPWGSTERVYRKLFAQRGKAEMYFHVSEYNFFGQGYPAYAGVTKRPQGECAAKLIEIAKKVGGKGVVLECVDFSNYGDDVNAALGQANAKHE